VLGIAAIALLGTGAVQAASQSVDGPATVAAPADRVIEVTTASAGEGLLFPIDPLPRCVLINGFGGYSKSGQRNGHQGVDIGADLGQEVYAVEDGKLYDQWTDGNPGLGWGLHGDSDTRYRYFHLSAFAEDLEVGDRVEKGQVIGYVGDTGNATPGGWHLHFEVHERTSGSRYQAVDPLPLLAVPSVCTNLIGR
jgi:murein DD-endopeptidase MepM/ murein hydrolase activator NlpD